MRSATTTKTLASGGTERRTMHNLIFPLIGALVILGGLFLATGGRRPE